MRTDVNPGDDLSVNQLSTGGYLVGARDWFTERQHRGLAVLIALSAAQLMDPDRADTDVLDVLWAA
jgi:hypothetical protein